MAASLTVFSVTPLAGIKLSNVSSAPLVADLTAVFASDGHTYRLGKSGGSAIGSIATVAVGTAGSIRLDAGSAGFTMNAPGGLVAGQHGWFKKTTL